MDSGRICCIVDLTLYVNMLKVFPLLNRWVVAAVPVLFRVG